MVQLFLPSTGVSRADTSEARLIRELGRFLAICSAPNYRGQGLMPHGLLDEFWHAWLEQPGYSPWSLLHFGKVVGHEADVVAFPHIKGDGRLDWVKFYQELFGVLDPIWFVDETGFDDERFTSYLAEGHLTAAYHCQYHCTCRISPEGGGFK